MVVAPCAQELTNSGCGRSLRCFSSSWSRARPLPTRRCLRFSLRVPASPNAEASLCTPAVQTSPLVYIARFAVLQMFAYQKEKYRRKDAGEEAGPYARGFIESGLWAYSRHPNYFCGERRDCTRNWAHSRWHCRRRIVLLLRRALSCRGMPCATSLVLRVPPNA